MQVNSSLLPCIDYGIQNLRLLLPPPLLRPMRLQFKVVVMNWRMVVDCLAEMQSSERAVAQIILPAHPRHHHLPRHRHLNLYPPPLVAFKKTQPQHLEQRHTYFRPSQDLHHRLFPPECNHLPKDTSHQLHQQPVASIPTIWLSCAPKELKIGTENMYSKSTLFSKRANSALPLFSSLCCMQPDSTNTTIATQQNHHHLFYSTNWISILSKTLTYPQTTTTSKHKAAPTDSNTKS